MRRTSRPLALVVGAVGAAAVRNMLEPNVVSCGTKIYRAFKKTDYKHYNGIYSLFLFFLINTYIYYSRFEIP